MLRTDGIRVDSALRDLHAMCIHIRYILRRYIIRYICAVFSALLEA